MLPALWSSFMRWRGGCESAAAAAYCLPAPSRGFLPGSYQAVYNATNAFVDSFSWALRDELLETGVSVTCLMPGPTDTKFFERADLLDTDVGEDDSKDDPADVARTGYKAMMSGEAGVVSGMSNKLQAAIAHVTPSSMLARRHRKMAKPHGE